MDAGAYVEPLVRTTWVHSPMVSGYVGSRLRVADQSFGTNYTGLNLEDGKVQMTIENVSTGTNIYFKVQSSYATGANDVRVAITPEYGIAPGGKRVVDFFTNTPYIEIKCTGGGGNVRTQLASRLKWEHMAMSRTDTFGAPQLWNKSYAAGPGVVVPAPFPTA